VISFGVGGGWLVWFLGVFFGVVGVVLVCVGGVGLFWWGGGGGVFFWGFVGVGFFRSVL